MENADMFTEPETPKKGGVPTWVWLVGGLVLCGVIGVCAAVVGVIMFGRNVAEEGVIAPVDEIIATISAGPDYHEEFNSVGDWGSGDVEDSNVPGGIAATSYVEDGVFKFVAHRADSYFWSTAEENFGDGTYEVEARATGGPLNNGFGMLFMLDDVNDNFYTFEVSSDGFVLVLYCEAVCDGETKPLAEEGWFESTAVNQGLNATNRLRVNADKGVLTFYVNDQQVAQATDTTLQSGNIGIIVETFEDTGEGIQVEFDNFTYTRAPGS